jgi:hypothetical protein
MSQDKPLALCLTARSKKLQEKPLDVQFNSQDVFGYMLPPKECWFKYMKFSKSENQEETDHPQTYEPWTINEAPHDMSYSSRDD